MDGCECEHNTLLQEGTTVCEHELKMLLQEAPIERGPDWLSRESTSRHTWPLQEAPLEGVPTTLEARGTC